MRGINKVLTAAIVIAVLVNDASPQSASIQVNNQALFGLGAVLLASGLAYHVGRQHASSDQQGGGRRQNGFLPFFGRRRRQVETPLNELDPMVGQLFQMALEKDTTGCSLQLVCAIGTQPPPSLTGHAKNLHQILSVNTEKLDKKTKSSWTGLDAFRTALTLGQDGGNCDQLFPYCSNSSEQLMDMFQKMQVLQN